MIAKWPEKGKRYVQQVPGATVGLFFEVIRVARTGEWADVRVWLKGTSFVRRITWGPGIERRDWTDAELPGHEAVER